MFQILRAELRDLTRIPASVRLPVRRRPISPAGVSQSGLFMRSGYSENTSRMWSSPLGFSGRPSRGMDTLRKNYSRPFSCAMGPHYTCVFNDRKGEQEGFGLTAPVKEKEDGTKLLYNIRQRSQCAWKRSRPLPNL